MSIKMIDQIEDPAACKAELGHDLRREARRWNQRGRGHSSRHPEQAMLAGQ